MGIYVVN